jgi:hypothetical protein
MNELARHPQDADLLLLPPRETLYVLEDVLEKIVLRCRDELILALGDSFVRFGVNIDTDTITSEFQPGRLRTRKGYRSVGSEKPWKSYVGKKCGWTWLAWNQQGYLDSTLLSFDGIVPGVLLQTIASSIEVFTISPVERLHAPGPGKGGQRKANGKR